MKSIGSFLATSLVAVSLSYGANAADTPSVDTVLATVDGTNITLGNVIALRDRLPKQYKRLPDDILFKGIVDQLIQQTVLMDAIKGKLDQRARVGLENEKRAYLAADMLAKISGREISEKDLKAAYDLKYSAAIPEQEYNASHILVKTKAEAKKIEKLLADGADFAALAKEKSTGRSGPNGGKLGWFGQNDMVKPFEDAVKKLAIGETSPPVKTQFGWHVIRLNDMRNKAAPKMDDVRAALTQEIQKKAVEAEIIRLMDKADIVRAKVDIDPSVIRDISLFNK